MRSILLACALFVVSSTLLVQPSAAWLNYQGGHCWQPECQVACPRGYARPNEWSSVCESVNVNGFSYYAYPLLTTQSFEGNVFQHHVSAWGGYGPTESEPLTPGTYRIIYSVKYPVWINPVQQRWNTKRSVVERKTVVHTLPEPEGPYGAVGLDDTSVQHIPMESVTCDDWMWDGCPQRFTVWYKILVRDASGTVIYRAMYPQLFEGVSVQP